MQGVVIASDAEVSGLLCAGLAGVCDTVAVHANAAAEVFDDAAIVAVAASAPVAETVWKIASALRAPIPIVVMVRSKSGRPELEAVLEAARASENVVAVVGEKIDGAQVSANALAELFGRALGQHSVVDCLPEGTRVHRVRVASYDDKLACLKKLERFARDQGIRTKYRQALAQCADELLMNALYSAPREARAADTEISAQAAVREAPGVLVRYAYVVEQVYVSVLDTFGVLDRANLLQHWDAAARARGEDDGDGGLGMYIVSNASSAISLTAVPGVATEVTCRLDTRAAKLAVLEVGIALNADENAVRKARELALRSPETEAPAAKSDWKLLVVLGLIAVLLALAVMLGRR